MNSTVLVFVLVDELLLLVLVLVLTVDAAWKAVVAAVVVFGERRSFSGFVVLLSW